MAGRTGGDVGRVGTQGEGRGCHHKNLVVGVIEVRLMRTGNVDELLSQSGEHFVEAAYLSLLGRAVDPTGRHFYVRRLASGVRKEQILKEICTSSEWRKTGLDLQGLREALIAANLDVEAHGEADGILIESSRSKASDIQIPVGTGVAGSVANSLEELIRRQGGDFVRGAFLTLLHREPDEAGLAFYLKRLESGAQKIKLINEIYSSYEAQALNVSLPGLGRALTLYALSNVRLVGAVIRKVFDLEGESQIEIARRANEQRAFQLACELEERSCRNESRNIGSEANVGDEHRERRELQHDIDPGAQKLESEFTLGGAGGADHFGAKEKAEKRPRIEEVSDFDGHFYLLYYPDIAAAGIDPHSHFLIHGKAEGRLGKMPSLEVLGDWLTLKADLDTVLIVSHEGSRTGAPMLTHGLVTKLAKSYNVIALFIGPGPLLQSCFEAGAIVVGPLAVNTLRPTLTDKLVTQVTNAAQVRIKFAIVNSIESRPVLASLARLHIPTISLVHEFASYTRPRDAFVDVSLWSNRVVFSSEITRNNAVDAFPELRNMHFPILAQGRCLPDKLSVAPSNLHKDMVNRIRSAIRPSSFPKGGFVVLGAGFVHIRKGVDLFIDCASRALAKAPELPMRFVWVGKGYDPDGDVSYSVYLADQIRRAGITEHIHFVGETDDIEAVYEESDVLLLSSRLDPLPNVAIDVMACGRPVICFDRATGIAGILKSDALAANCVANYFDTEDMANKLVALGKSRELRHSVGQACERLATKFFNMDSYVKEIVALAAAAVIQTAQEKSDIETISQSSRIDIEYFLDPRQSLRRDEAIRMYVRSWSSGIRRRKLFPGFHPGIYLEQHGVKNPGADPLADYLQAGQPRGKWTFNLASSTEKPRSVPAELKVALHIHAYFPELVPELMERLLLNKVRPDLFISVTGEEARAEVEEHVASYEAKVSISVVPNRGRDLGPLIAEFGKTLVDGYHLIGHLHTKKSTDIKDAWTGRSWYNYLLENLLGGKACMADIILGRMANEPSIDIVFPDDPNIVGWGQNYEHVHHLLTDDEKRKGNKELVFPVGTMFWARPSALKVLFEPKLDWKDFPEEPLPYDGSILHGLERMLGFAASRRNEAILLTHVEGSTR